MSIEVNQHCTIFELCRIWHRSIFKCILITTLCSFLESRINSYIVTILGFHSVITANTASFCTLYESKVRLIQLDFRQVQQYTTAKRIED